MAAFRRRQSGGRRVLVVGYHRVVDDFARESRRSIPGTLISQRTFERHLLDAHAAGFAFATLGEALDVLSGRKTAKKDLFVVTFDDGYRDVYRYAWPVLKRLGIPSIMYLPSGMVGTDRRFNHDRLFHLVRLMREHDVTPVYAALPVAAEALLRPIFSGRKSPSDALDDFIGDHSTEVLTQVIDALEHQLGGGKELVPESGDIMNWDEVRAMADSGMEMGAHTVGHRVLTLEDPPTVRRELAQAKAEIEREIGRPVRDFAYCNGWYSDEVIQTLVDVGYRSAVTTEDLPNRIGGEPFTLKRKVLWENFSVGAFGRYSALLTGCHFDDVFGMLGATHPVLGKRRQRVAWAEEPRAVVQSAGGLA